MADSDCEVAACGITVRENRLGCDGGGEDEDTDAGRLKYWLAFMEKWGYQPAQKQAIRQVAAGE